MYRMYSTFVLSSSEFLVLVCFVSFLFSELQSFHVFLHPWVARTLIRWQIWIAVQTTQRLQTDSWWSGNSVLYHCNPFVSVLLLTEAFLDHGFVCPNYSLSFRVQFTFYMIRGPFGLNVFALSAFDPFSCSRFHVLMFVSSEIQSYAKPYMWSVFLPSEFLEFSAHW
jgi:hypothetical protein